jgi:hypothetical protein
MLTYADRVLLEQVSSQLVANIISHGPLGGIIIRGTSKVVVRGNTICHNDGANIAVLDNRCDVCCRMLPHAAVCCRKLPYAAVSCRKLPYADVC